jgi:hypothetical protein
MNAPETFIPFYGEDFFTAVEGLPKSTAFIYLKLIWHYWSRTHCTGLKNDDEFLKRVGNIQDWEWPQVKTELFTGDGFFTLESDGFWHQLRAAHEWKRRVSLYNYRSIAGKTGAKARWKK